MSRARRTAGLVLAAMVVLLVWWGWPRSPEAAPMSPRAVSPSTAPRAPAPVVPRPSEPEAPHGLRLRAVLEGAHPFRGEARVGAAFISGADQALWEAARREGSTGAGPARREDLANVAEWATAPVTPIAMGGALGPVPVPEAPRYRLLAWEEDGTFWWGDLLAPSEAPASGVLEMGVLRARAPTGVRVRLEGARPEHGAFSVRLERVVDARDAERASELLPLVRHAAPRIASALEDAAPLPLSSDAETPLLPLPPDPSVRLWLRAASGQEGSPVEVPLREGSVAAVTLDVARLLPGGPGGTLTLRGRLLLEGASHPPRDVRLEGPEGQGLEVGADGRFTVSGVPSWRPSRFVARVPPPAAGRPVAPEHWDFDFVPEAGATEARVTWRVPAYRWLELKLEDFVRSELRVRSRAPYPVYLLQRLGAEGAWKDQPADAFLPEPEGLAISIVEPGTYRLLVATSSYEEYASTSAVLGEGGPERSVTLPWADAEGPPCEVRVSVGGRPAYGALVTASGPSGSLPPFRGRTDGEGRLRLGRVRTRALHVEVELEGQARQVLEGLAECQTSGVVDVRL